MERLSKVLYLIVFIGAIFLDSLLATAFGGLLVSVFAGIHVPFKGILIVATMITVFIIIVFFVSVFLSIRKGE